MKILSRSCWTTLLFIAASLSFAETQSGIVFGGENEGVTNRGGAQFHLWVAGTESGPLLGFLNYVSFPKPGGGGNVLYFTAYRLRSFRGYESMLFGKVADIWAEGLAGPDPGMGKPAVLHFRVTDSAKFTGRLAYFTADIFDANSLNKPTISEVGYDNNHVRVIIADGTGPEAGGQLGSDNGLAYSNTFGGITNRKEKVTAEFWVASNGVMRFALLDPHIGLVGTRLKSFHCANNTFLGKAAEFWMDGYMGPNTKNAHTPVVAQVLVTDSSADYGLEFMLYSIYDPSNLTTPTYQRLVVRNNGDTKILCK